VSVGALFIGRQLVMPNSSNLAPRKKNLKSSHLSPGGLARSTAIFCSVSVIFACKTQLIVLVRCELL
jgi:hypothetical protein